MMGQQTRTGSLFYYFRIEDQIPKDHLLRVIDEQIDLNLVRERVKDLYSATGRPSIDCEVLLRLLDFPQIWVASWENRDLRQLLWHRHRMVKARTRIMNQLQAVALNRSSDDCQLISTAKACSPRTLPRICRSQLQSKREYLC